MTFRLYVMRHGDALIKAPKDSLRPLSPLGHEQAVGAAQYLAGRIREQGSIELVLASPYLRAQETAQKLASTIGYSGELKTCVDITPNDSPDDVIRLLSTYEPFGSVLMVSHQPLVSALIGRLVSGHYHDGVPMGTASIVCLEMPTVGAGMAELVWVKHSEL